MHELANDLRIACQMISRRVKFEGSDELAPHLLTVLCRLDSGKLTPTDLAGIEKVSTPCMTRTINCLEEKGLVKRTPHPDDRRQVLVSLTEEGKKTLKKVMEDRNSWMVSRLAKLEPAELEILQKSVMILKEVANQ